MSASHLEFFEPIELLHGGDGVRIDDAVITSFRDVTYEPAPGRRDSSHALINVISPPSTVVEGAEPFTPPTELDGGLIAQTFRLRRTIPDDSNAGVLRVGQAIFVLTESNRERSTFRVYGTTPDQLQPNRRTGRPAA